MHKTWAASLAAVALTLTACGGGGNDTDGAADTTPTTDEGPRTVTVGMLPILPTAALYAGIEQGFFEEQGLELEIQEGQGGSALSLLDLQLEALLFEEALLDPRVQRRCRQDRQHADRDGPRSFVGGGRRVSGAVGVVAAPAARGQGQGCLLYTSPSPRDG